MSELPKNMKELLRHFPRKIPKAFCEEINDRARQHVLYCYDKEDRQKAICTRCGRKVIIPYNKLHQYTHKAFARCPYCSENARVVHLWRNSNMRYQPILSYHFARSLIDPDVITCMCIYTAYIDHSDTPWKDTPFQVVDAYYVFVPGKGGIMAADKRKIYKDSIYTTSSGEFKYFWPNKPFIRSSIRARDRIYHLPMQSTAEVYVHCTSLYDMEEVVKGTSIEYAWAAFRESLLGWSSDNESIYIKLLEYICRNPLAIEYLAKVGFERTIKTAIWLDQGIGRAFNLRGKNLDAITRGRMSKADKRYLMECRKEKRTVLIEDFQTWQMVRKMPGGKGISLEESVTRLGYKTFHEISCLNYVRYDKLFRYLDKQKDKSPGVRVNIGLYSDYITGCHTLGADMESKSTLWPANLIQVHNNQRIAIIAKAKAEEEAEYKKRRAAIVKKYSFEAMGFMIVVPELVADLVREGTDMHNCVGTYTERVANGSTCVVYIRKTESPDISFGTMEINKEGDRIVQARGKYNKDLPPEAQAFVKAFEEAKIKKHKRSKAA